MCKGPNVSVVHKRTGARNGRVTSSWKSALWENHTERDNGKHPRMQYGVQNTARIWIYTSSLPSRSVTHSSSHTFLSPDWLLFEVCASLIAVFVDSRCRRSTKLCTERYYRFHILYSKDVALEICEISFQWLKDMMFLLKLVENKMYDEGMYWKVFL